MKFNEFLYRKPGNAALRFCLFVVIYVYIDIHLFLVS